MAEESFLNEKMVTSTSTTSVEVKTVIDEVLTDEDDLVVPEADENKGIINDPAEKIKKINLDIENRRKKLDEMTKSMHSELKDAVKKEKAKKIWGIVFFIFMPNNWIKAIQFFEDFLMVLLLDLPIVMILFSLLYILYIIFTFDINNWVTYVSKLGGCIILTILSLIIQLNVNSNTKEK